MVICRNFVSLTLILLLAGAPAVASTVQLTWRDAARVVTGRRAVIVLPNGAEVAGSVVKLHSDGLLVDVRDPKQTMLLSRKNVFKIRLSRRGIKWQLTGITAGFLLGGFVGYQAGVRAFGANSPKGLNLALAVLAGMMFAGFLIGRQADREITLIEIIRPGNLQTATLTN